MISKRRRERRHRQRVERARKAKGRRTAARQGQLNTRRKFTAASALTGWFGALVRRVGER